MLVVFITVSETMNFLEYSILCIQFLTIHFFPFCKEASWGDMVICNKSDSKRWPGACKGSWNNTATVSPGEGGVGYFQVIKKTSSRGMCLNVETFKIKLYSLPTTTCSQVPFLARNHENLCSNIKKKMRAKILAN